MLQVDNFKFKQLLEQSCLSVSEKFDVSTIFNCLSDARKMEIIDSWAFYLNQILILRNEVQDMRRENIALTLKNINNIVNESILRQREEDEKKHRESIERQNDNRGALNYDQMRKANDLQALLKKQHEQQ